MRDVELVIIGGGPAGMAAAIAARQQGTRDILLLERESHLGGILNQCIHGGFGLHRFKEELTGPEYAARYVKEVRELGIPHMPDTMVLTLNKNKVIVAASRHGIHEIRARAVILAMGCRERPRGALNIPGTRPVGIYTAGTAQKFVNIDGYMPGREAVILGSGDIGLIMARRMTLEGAKVHAVVELLPYSSGLKRNIVQCLDDYGIPLMLSHTVTQIHGKKRLCGVTVAQVDEHRRPIEETAQYIPCDTLLLSVGLLPENELSKWAGVELSPVTGGALVGESLQTDVEGIFSCGNALHVHDLVDYVSQEGEAAGISAANYLQGKRFKTGGIPVKAGEGVRYAVPQSIHPDNIDDAVTIRFRVAGVYENCCASVFFDDRRHCHQRSIILSPGEMESVTLKKDVFDAYPDTKEITVAIEREVDET
ncbi:MAG: NAD(P)/FAD-dependent oxidoreductase [Christensenellales bacterium]|jgi:NADPH-dependent 2,4-dienoyl-CoA reductase/sulfur reductase-like enzyme